ncbi:MAG: signal peptidase I [Thermogladius sp.]
MRGLTRAVLKALTLVLVVAVLTQVLLYLINSSQTTVAVVEGSSMYPLMREGDLVFAYRPAPNDIRVGDVVIYRVYNKLIIHRVIDVIVKNGEYYYVTQGDNNPIPDYIYFDVVDGVPVGVSYSRIVGVVLSVEGHTFKIPYLGYLAIWYHELVKS